MNKFAIGQKFASGITEFCAQNSLSRTTLFELWKAGRGPKVMRVGRRVLITEEAGAEWRERMQAESVQPGPKAIDGGRA
ncbi:MAG: hypothetical protein V9G29_00755 [Burkholderiaceae bacterium]